jgi:branched-chain amino acid transport system permease protein
VAIDLPLRMLVPFVVALLLVASLQLFFGRSFNRAGDPRGVAGPARVAADGGQSEPDQTHRLWHIVIIIQPVEPSIGRDYIGRIFAICVLGGMTSFPGMVAGAMLIGVAESITATFYGPSWAPAVAFGFLLLTLAIRPAGILGR